MHKSLLCTVVDNKPENMIIFDAVLLKSPVRMNILYIVIFLQPNLQSWVILDINLNVDRYKSIVYSGVGILFELMNLRKWIDYTHSLA